MSKKGIDISHHQGDIDFNKLKGSIDFAMVRTSYGNFHLDKKYKRNIEGLESIGVPYGLYHFSYATTKEEAKGEAKGFLNIIKNYKPLYPVVVDIESSSRTENVRKDTLVDIAKTFCSIVQNAGYYVMIYANLNYFETKLNSSILNKYDKWVAEWRDKFTYNGNAGMWQYSSKGRMPGISGNVDLDASFKDYPKIIKENKLNNYNGNSIVNNDNTNSNNNIISYVVKKGDTLSSIASKYNTTYQKLAKYNGIKNPNKIYPGEIIKIPSSNITPTTYVVKKGDTLSGIASKFGLNWKTLYNNNKSVIGNNPNKIYPGMVLNI